MNFYIIGTTIIYVITILCGILLSDLEKVTSFIGALAGNAIAWALPAAIYIKLARNKKGVIYNSAIGLFCFGIFSIIISLIGTFW